MHGQSRLLLGLVQQTPDTLESEAALWDRSTVVQTIWDQAKARSEWAREADAKVRAAWEASAKPTPAKAPVPDRHPLDPALMVLTRLAAHAGQTLDPSAGTAALHHAGLGLERKAVELQRAADDRGVVARLRRDKRAGFEGETIDDLVVYVVTRLFANLETQLANASAAEREAAAEKILAALHRLSPEEQERLRRHAQVDQLSAATLQQAGVLSSVGVGVAGLVGVAGFAAYTTITSVMFATAGLVGVTLPFSAYVGAVSIVHGFVNPFFLVPTIAGGGYWLNRRANARLHDALFPTFVAYAVMAEAAASPEESRVGGLCARMAERAHAVSLAAEPQLAQLRAQYPGLGKPSQSADWTTAGGLFPARR